VKSKPHHPRQVASRPGTLSITDVKAWSNLMVPARVEIAEVLRCMGPCTMSQLASILARPADTLYRHMQHLEAAGLVLRSTTRQPGKRSEAVYQFVADDVTPGFPPDRKGQQALLGMTNAFFRTAVHSVRDSAQAQKLRFGALPQGEEPNIAILYELGWLSPESLKQARSLLAQLKQLMDEGKRSAKGELFMSFALLTPVTRKHKRAGKPAMPTTKQSQKRASKQAPKASR
jgi:hypothetical protein